MCGMGSTGTFVWTVVGMCGDGETEQERNSDLQTGQSRNRLSMVVQASFCCREERFCIMKTLHEPYHKRLRSKCPGGTRGRTTSLAKGPNPLP